MDFESPLESGDPRWQDLSIARGDDATIRLRRLFDRKPPGQPLHAVFSSHRGAGKTTELKRFAHDLRSQYVCIYLEANVELDAVEFAMEDLLLVLARAVEQLLRERETPLPANLLKDVERWFTEMVITQTLGQTYAAEIQAGAKAKGGLPFFAELFAKLTSLFKVSSEHREQVKSTLRRYPGELTRQVNSLFSGAAEVLSTEQRELLVIIDNMDRYSPKLIDELLVRDGDRFRQLGCNLVLTPPISLILRPESQSVDSIFKSEVMPTVRLRAQTEPYTKLSGPGRDALLAALSRRIDLDTLLPDEKARDRLVWASGGAIRELLELAHDSVLDVDTPPITLPHVDRVLERRRQRLRDRIDVNGWLEPLVAIGRSKRLTEDSKCLEVLFQRLAFHYDGEVWYDVHPLVTEIPDFKGSLALPRSRRKKVG